LAEVIAAVTASQETPSEPEEIVIVKTSSNSLSIYVRDIFLLTVIAKEEAESFC